MNPQVTKNAPSAGAMSVLRKRQRATAVSKLIWGDFAAIEARGVVWAAGQRDVLELFRTGDDVYKHMAGQIFNKPPDKVQKEERQIGKTTVLACGYGMGKARFQATCARGGQDVSIELAEQAVRGWREANRHVVDLWRALNDAAISAVRRPGDAQHAGPFAFRVDGIWLKMRYPSGRLMWFCRPQVVPGRFGGDALSFECQSAFTHQWTREQTYGGQLMAYGVQGMCRDLLAAAMRRIDQDIAECAPEEPFGVMLSVHDEIIAEVPYWYPTERFERLMAEGPSWATGFPIKSELREGTRYGK